MSRVLEIYTSPGMGEPMQLQSSVRAIAGVGLEGDRYGLGTGAFSRERRATIRHASLIGIEAIAAANKALERPFTAWETRRNIVTQGVELNDLVGEFFTVGEVAMVGVELCTPCARPSKLADKPDFKTAFEGFGGLRVGILSTGLISIGDAIS